MKCNVIVLATALFSIAVLNGADAHDHAVSRGRLIFSDFEKNVVRVLDLDTGEVTHTLDVPKSNVGFSTVEDGRYVVVRIGGDAGAIKILDTGLIIDAHGVACR